ncbi:hypothetical protein BaRGS_00025866 [Batillaria attramentaria]|uniref:Uncharacterized protein n=1 Tax=Batillaria attramentaria TaxID=370345 RepID=A0ABD0K7C9_9CAEN
MQEVLLTSPTAPETEDSDRQGLGRRKQDERGLGTTLSAFRNLQRQLDSLGEGREEEERPGGEGGYTQQAFRIHQRQSDSSQTVRESEPDPGRTFPNTSF